MYSLMAYLKQILKTNFFIESFDLPEPGIDGEQKDGEFHPFPRTGASVSGVRRRIKAIRAKQSDRLVT